jgi:hypothetical protein
MKAYGGSGAIASRPGRFTSRERAPGIHCIGGWVVHRAVLDTVVKRKIPSPRRESNIRTRIVQPIALSLYRLSYHGSDSGMDLREISCDFVKWTELAQCPLVGICDVIDDISFIFPEWINKLTSLSSLHHEYIVEVK